MISILLQTKGAVRITREHVHALVYSSLPDHYHELGSGRTYENQDPVRNHSILVYSGNYQKNDLVNIEVRGIGTIEEDFQLPDKVQLGGVEMKVLGVVNHDSAAPLTMETVKPILIRLGLNRPEAQALLRPGQKTAYWVYEDDPKGWTREIENRLFTRGKLKNRPVITVAKAETVRDRHKGNLVKGTMATLTFNDPYWAKLAYQLGIGERCTYGFGVLD